MLLLLFLLRLLLLRLLLLLLLLLLRLSCLPRLLQVFAPVLEGRDMIARSRTGTGKTLAFGVPMVT